MITYLVSIESNFKKKCTNLKPFFKKTKRNYETKHSELTSRKLYFYPEFLTRTPKNFFFFRIKKINSRKLIRKKDYLIKIFGIVYGIILMKRLLDSQTKYFYFLIFFTEKITVYIRSFFFILTFSLLFSQKTYSSKSIEQAFITGGSFIFFFEIETNFFFFAKNHEKLFLFIFANMIITLGFWTRKKFNKELGKNFSKATISFREIKILFATFSIIKFFFQGILNVLLFNQDNFLFPFFF